MKVLYVVGSYYPAQSGGPNNTIHWQAKYLSKSGFDVSVASLTTGLIEEDINRYGIKLNVESMVEGVKAHYFEYFFNRYLSVRLYLWLILNIRRFDFVQLTSYFFPITWLSALVCNLTKTPFSIAPRGELESNAIRFNKSLKILLHKILLQYVYKNTAFVLVTSRQELSFSKKYFDKNTVFELFPNYIEMPRDLPLPQDDILGKKNILYLGRIHQKKGIENLVSAYFSLSDHIINKHMLLIAGSGKKEYVDSLKDLVNTSRHKNRVAFLGHKKGLDKERLYKKSKVLVLPSYSENFGNVVLESLSFSTPVIASKYTPWESLEDCQCGFWVNNTTEEISFAIQKILTMRQEEYTSYSVNSLQYVATHFNIKENIKKLAHLYSQYSKNNDRSAYKNLRKKN